MNRKTAEKEQRIENILLSLKRFDYLTRLQIQIIHGLKSERNANRFLNSMSQYVGTFRHGLENVYYLNKAGRERVQCDVIRKKTPNIQHYLLRNQMWMALKYPRTWENEIKIKVGDVSIVCDAKYVLKGGVHVFVEVDVSQPMATNQKKIEKYKKMQELTGQPFHLLWVTELESRREKLKSMCEGLNAAVYTLADIK